MPSEPMPNGIFRLVRMGLQPGRQVAKDPGQQNSVRYLVDNASQINDYWRCLFYHGLNRHTFSP